MLRAHGRICRSADHFPRALRDRKSSRIDSNWRGSGLGACFTRSSCTDSKTGGYVDIPDVQLLDMRVWLSRSLYEIKPGGATGWKSLFARSRTEIRRQCRNKPCLLPLQPCDAWLGHDTPQNNITASAVWQYSLFVLWPLDNTRRRPSISRRKV